MKKLVDLWCARFKAMSEDKKIKYVFIFENRGDVVGATMPHTHGQMYGYSVVPKKIELELDAAKEHYDENVECIFCLMNRKNTMRDFALFTRTMILSHTSPLCRLCIWRIYCLKGT